MSNKNITVTIAYASKSSQFLRELSIPSGFTAKQTILQAGLLREFPELDLTQIKIGIFSELQNLDYILREGDRIEIYRNLLMDPKQARRMRAQKKKLKPE